MRIISDLHIHSRFSRACSKQISIDNLEKYAKIKGLNLLGTGDFTHPKWLSELKELKEEEGLLKTDTDFPFIWQTEISLMYTQDGKGRRVHQVLLAPNGEVVKQINDFLRSKGRLDYDGRPIFGFSSIELVEKLMEISRDIEVIPAHLWTPFFSCLGSKSGFNSVKDCFKDQSKHIHAIETGLSSNPPMNWRLSELDNMTLMSNSDSHSFWPWRIGREANIIEPKELSYKEIVKAIREKKVATIEVDPNYGKYHFDGHRNCKICLEPKEAIINNNICPKCRRQLTIGVLHRVEELADRPEGFKPEGAQEYYSLIPLSEIISSITRQGIATKVTWKIFWDLINRFGNEFNVLLEAKEEDLLKVADEKIAKAIIDNRKGIIKIKPGYDGEYGYPVFDEEDEKNRVKTIKEFKETKGQKGLSDFF